MEPEFTDILRDDEPFTEVVKKRTTGHKKKRQPEPGESGVVNLKSCNESARAHFHCLDAKEGRIPSLGWEEAAKFVLSIHNDVINHAVDEGGEIPHREQLKEFIKKIADVEGAWITTSGIANDMQKLVEETFNGSSCRPVLAGFVQLDKVGPFKEIRPGLYKELDRSRKTKDYTGKFYLSPIHNLFIFISKGDTQRIRAECEANIEFHGVPVVSLILKDGLIVLSSMEHGETAMSWFQRKQQYIAGEFDGKVVLWNGNGNEPLFEAMVRNVLDVGKQRYILDIFQLHWNNDILMTTSNDKTKDQILWASFLTLCENNDHQTVDIMMKQNSLFFVNFPDEQRVLELFELLDQSSDVHVEFISKHLPQAFRLKDVGEFMRKTLDNKIENLFDLTTSSEEDWDRYYFFKSFFIWAILFNRKELSRVFWENYDGGLEGAVFAAWLLRALAKRSQHVTGGASYNYYQLSNYYSEISGKVLDVCWKRNPRIAPKLVIQRHKEWGNRNMLTMAHNANMIDFTAHDACFEKLHDVWRGDLSKECHPWKIALFCLCPFIMVWFLTFVRKYNERKTPNQSADQFERNEDERRREDERTDFSENISQQRSNLVVGRFNGDERIGYFHALIRGFRAPVVKFYYNLVYGLIYLIVFGVFLCTELEPFEKSKRVGGHEIVTYIFFLIGIVGEIFQIVLDEELKFGSKLSLRLKWYWHDFRNPFDVIYFAVFSFAFLLRCTLPEDHFNGARFAFCVSLVLLLTRFMQNLYAFQSIGPKLTMIHKMLGDLVFFVVIATLVMFGYGVCTITLLTPKLDYDGHLISAIFYKPYWQMYGELSLEDYQQDNCNPEEENSSDNCTTTDYKLYGLRPLLLVIYMVLTNLLLFNLLIAMFSNTAQRVHDRAQSLWRYQYYSVVKENHFRAILPPLIVFKLLIERKVEWKPENHFCPKLSLMERKELSDLSYHSTEQYILDENNSRVKTDSINWLQEYLEQENKKRCTVDEQNQIFQERVLADVRELKKQQRVLVESLRALILRMTDIEAERGLEGTRHDMVETQRRPQSGVEPEEQ